MVLKLAVRPVSDKYPASHLRSSGNRSGSNAAKDQDEVADLIK